MQKTEKKTGYQQYICMKKSVFIIMIIFSSCSTHSGKFRHIELVIEHEKSYKYDLQKELYTVHYIDKPSREIKFKLSDEEKKSISVKYYELNLNQLSEDIIIKSNCNIIPEIYTTLFIKRNNNTQEIKIETGCNDFNIFNKGKANRVKIFLNYVYEILNSKPDIKNTPKSNIPYM